MWLYPEAVYPGSRQGSYAFVRDADGRLTLFRVNGQPSRARGITDSGVITGFLDDPTTVYKGFVTKLQGSSGYQAVSIPDSSLLVSPLQGATYGRASQTTAPFPVAHSILLPASSTGSLP